nr:DUF5518 domain-containing protein [Halegenticoccus tardaugens]
MGAGLTGVVAGYVDGRKMTSGAVHGALATIIGVLVVGAVLVLLGTLVSGILGLGLAALFAVLLVEYAIPGAVGGALGSTIKNSTAASRARPAAK